MELLSEALTPQQQKRAAVLVGRFNPPHAGHYHVLNQVKKYIREHPELKLDAVPIVVIVDGEVTGQDKTRNPLSAQDRVMFMRGSGNANGVRFMKAGSAFDAFEQVRKAGYEPIAIAAGSDRAAKYLELLSKYFKSRSGSKIKRYAIEVDRAEADKDLDQIEGMNNVLKYMDDSVPVSMVSGTFARHAVQNDELQKFAIIVGLKDKPKLAKLMFDKIKKAQAE